MLLTREQLLATIPPPREVVAVPELGSDGVLLVQGLTLAGRDEWEHAVFRDNGKSIELNQENLRARLIVRCVVDEAGTRLLQDADADLVGRWPPEVGLRVFAVCQRLSALGPKDVEELAGNSGGDQRD